MNNATCENTPGLSLNLFLAFSDLNECDFNRCVNNATSENTPGLSLNLFLAFSDLNECDFNRCVNNATCENTPGSFICNCQDGFEGQYCETGL